MNAVTNPNVTSDVFRRINTHRNDPDVCWEWTGHTAGRDQRGYMNINNRRYLVYRIVYEMFHGVIPEDRIVRHTCDNPLCCNPKHLILGSQSDNEHDKYHRDRWGYTNEMVRQIRRYHKLGMSYRAIARRINDEFDTSVTFSGVGKIIRGERRTQKNTHEQE